MARYPAIIAIRANATAPAMLQSWVCRLVFMKVLL
jgi:hypothetical protein